MANVDTDILC